MSKKPNILVVLIDDMGWRDLQCFGSTFYETPCIDQLAKDGTSLTQAYATCPVCSPSRASLLTGKYPARLGLTVHIGSHSRGKLFEVPYVDHLSTEEFAMPKALQKAGYQTWHIGKWHLGSEAYYPENHGFDVNIGGCHAGGPGDEGYFSPYNIPVPDALPDGVYLTDYLCDKAVELIENAGDKPFYMNLSHYAVHTPIFAKEEDIAKFEAKSKRMKLDEINPIVEGDYFPCSHKKHMKIQRRLFQSDVEMAAMIWNLDQNTGKVIDALKRTGKYDDTIIVFTSDNGGLSSSEGSHTCNAPLAEGKGWMYDGGIRIPLIFKGEGISKSTISEQITTGTDIYPTLMELAGLNQVEEQHVDGISIANALRGGEIIKDRPIFWHFPHYGNQGGTPTAAVRFNEYKLIKFYEDNHVELYNLSEDISESFNIADENPEMTMKLTSMLEEWVRDVGGIVPTLDPDYVV